MRPTRTGWRWLMASAAAGLIALLGWGSLYWETKSSSTSGHGYTQVNLRDLEAVSFDQVRDTERDLPATIRSLDGRPVVIAGLQYVGSTDSEVAEFQLVREFRTIRHRPPTIQERVFCDARPGSKVPVYGHDVRVYGTFHIKVERDSQSRAMSLFTMTVDKVVDPLGTAK